MVVTFKDFLIMESSNQSNDKIFRELTTFKVSLETSNSSDNLYIGTDKNKATREFNNPNIPSEWLDRSDVSVDMSTSISIYEFCYVDSDGELQVPDDYPVEDYHMDKDVYKLVEEGEWETIDTNTIEPVNKKSDELLEEVQSYYRSKYGKYKYNIIQVEDEDGDDVGTIQLRIADHTENIHNIDRHDRHDYYISVVISDYDPTEQRFGMSNAFERRRNEFEFRYDGDTVIDEITGEVDDKIDELTERLKK